MHKDTVGVGEARFLVLSDLHLAGVLKRHDIKSPAIPGLDNPSRVSATTDLLTAIASHLRARDLQLEAVIFAGDAQDKGSAGSHEAAYEAILKAFGEFGITPGKIVSTPGNHDVLKGSAPGAPERYKDFASVWRDKECIVPWLDGLDAEEPEDTSRYRLVASDNAWAVYPINTSNWSQVRADVPVELKSIWDELPKAYAPDSAILQEKIKAALDKLLDYDMAHISNEQLKVLRRTFAETPDSKNPRQVRLAVMHHHLRSPTLRLEVKPFESIVNLEQIRSLLKECNVGAVVHGHKHEHAFRYDYVETDDPDAPYRLAVVSAGTFQDGREEDAALLVTLRGLPYVPELTVERVALPHSGLNLTLKKRETLSLQPIPTLSGAPVILQGADFDELYARATKHAEAHSGEMLVVHYDPRDSSVGLLQLPSKYPRPANLSDEEMQSWLNELVAWWQLSRSRRDNDFPYPHGARLRLFGGKLNQIDRIVNVLHKEPSSRALAVLVDPLRDFNQNGEGEAFPSFTLMQVSKRIIARERYAIDIVGFYRAQEFSQWWPVNVAELRLLQNEIAEELKAAPGRITTITTDARFKPQGPGQVAVPVFDRWVDQSPEKLFMLALTLTGDVRNKVSQNLLVREWLRSLTDIETAASATNIDGVLIPAEGMQMLVTYLEMIDKNAERAQLLQALRNLLLVNRQFQQSDKRKGDRESWAGAVQRLIPEIISLSPDI